MTEVTSYPQFQKLVADKKLSVVDFYATWCPPCKAMDPIIRSWAEKTPEVQFLKNDVDASEDVAMMNLISAMPTFLLFKDGEKVAEVVGANHNKLRELIEQHSGIDVRSR